MPSTRFVVHQDPMTPRLREEALPTALVLIGFTALALCMPPHNDTWWHLRAGRDMVTTGAILTQESFSHTAAGRPLFHNHEWLSQLVLYGLFRAGGPPLLTMISALCALGAALAAWRYVEGPSDLHFVWLACIFVGSVSEWAIRPQVFSLLLFMVAVNLVIGKRDGWLPLLCLVWSNLHAVAIVGVIVAGASLVEAVLWSRERIRQAAIVLAACAAALMATPIGWHYWARTLEVIRLVRLLQIQEYRPATDWAHAPFWALAVAFAVLAARPAALRAATRETRILVLLGGIFLVAGATAVRNIPMFAMTAVPAVSRLLPARERPRRPRPMPTGGLVLIGVAVLSALAGVGMAWRQQGAALGWRPVSSAAIEALERCPDPLFNGLVEGGPLTWFVPDRKVFVDSRGVEAYPVDLLVDTRRAELEGVYVELFNRFLIRCAVVGPRSRLAGALDVDPQMERRYLDGTLAIFARR